MANLLYDIGDLIRLNAVFEVNGTATDPATVTLKVKDPSGNVATYAYSLAEISRAAAGFYYKDISLDEAGIWYYRFEGTGGAQAAEEGSFEVRTQKVA